MHRSWLLVLGLLLISTFGFGTISETNATAVGVPVVFGLLHSPQTGAESQASSATTAPVYEVASIKRNKSGPGIIKLDFPPNGLTATNVTLDMLIEEAYGVEEVQISGAPGWFKSEWYDIEAKVDSSVADRSSKLTEDQRTAEQHPMLQALLADRFKLTLHRESKELPVYALVIAKNGPKLQEAKRGDTYPNGLVGLDGHGAPRLMQVGRGVIICQALPVEWLVHALTLQLKRPVLDRTGLKGIYDYRLHWTPDDSKWAVFKGPEDQPGIDGTRLPEPSGPSIFTAIQEQLGLKLEPQKGPVDVLVIDHVERPSEN